MIIVGSVRPGRIALPVADWVRTTAEATEGIEVDFLSKQSAVETPYTGDIVTAISRSVLAEDPEAQVVPYLMPGGTDGKHWAKAGIDCFGFAPLRLPSDLDFTALFHGVDERVPIDALEFGARVFDRFLDLY